MYVGLARSQVEVGLSRIRVNFPAPFEHAHRYKCIEKVPDAARMKPETLSHILGVQASFGELGENAKLDRAKENFGRHEPESDLLDPICARLCAHHPTSTNLGFCYLRFHA